MNESRSTVQPAISNVRAPARSGLDRSNACETSLRQLRALVLGEQLAMLRRRRCLSQRALADRMGVPKAHVARLEQGNAGDLAQVFSYIATLKASMIAVPDGDDYAVMVE